MHFCSSIGRACTIESVREMARPILEKRGIELHTFFNVETIDPERKVVQSLEGDELAYGLLILVPPHRGARLVTDSGLAPGAAGCLRIAGRFRSRGFARPTRPVPGCRAGPMSTPSTTPRICRSPRLAPRPISNCRSWPSGSLPPTGREPDAKHGVYTGRVMCFFEIGYGKGTHLRLDYNHPPNPPRPNRFWHVGKILFNKTYWHTVPRSRVGPFAPPSPGRGILIRLPPWICRGGEIGRRPVTDDQRRTDWNKRHAAGDFEDIGPNPTLVAAASGLAPGRALELAVGSGTNAVWLASQGWQTTAVDWSPVGLANGRAKADAARLQVEWLERNLLKWSPPARAYDLVVIVYLHLEPEERRPVYARAAAAVAPGGRLLIVGHDRLNAMEGEGGPPDPARLFTADEIGRELATADPGLTVERADVVRRVPPPGRAPIDALLVLRRGDERKAYRSGKREMLPWLY